MLLRESLNQPLMVIFEDLHWIDRRPRRCSTCWSIRSRTRSILLLVNYRPEYHHQWGSKTYYTQLRLDPLGKESAEEMLSRAARRRRSDLAALKRLIIEQTEGNPFFMEEMVQALFDEGVLVRNGAVKLAQPLDADRRSRPRCRRSSPRASIGCRPRRRSCCRRWRCSAENFRSAWFEARGRRKQMTNWSGCSRDLQLGEFIYEQPAVGDVEYTFKHALTQEVAYNSVLVERRKLLHERAAQAIEALFAEQSGGPSRRPGASLQPQRQRRQGGRISAAGGQQAVQRSAYRKRGDQTRCGA